MTTPIGDLGTALLERAEVAADTPWKVVLWNDPVNIATHVTGILMRILQIGKERAEHLMLTAHAEGKAAVFDGSRDEASTKALQLLDAGLQATLEKD